MLLYRVDEKIRKRKRVREREREREGQKERGWLGESKRRGGGSVSKRVVRRNEGEKRQRQKGRS